MYLVNYKTMPNLRKISCSIFDVLSEKVKSQNKKKITNIFESELCFNILL